MTQCCNHFYLKNCDHFLWVSESLGMHFKLGFFGFKLQIMNLIYLWRWLVSIKQGKIKELQATRIPNLDREGSIGGENGNKFLWVWSHLSHKWLGPCPKLRKNLSQLLFVTPNLNLLVITIPSIRSFRLKKRFNQLAAPIWKSTIRN